MKQPNELHHVGLIMDGNRRWAVENEKSTAEGHKAGGEALKAILPAAVELGIQMLTVYAFSTENWKRPVSEIDAIVHLFGDRFGNQSEIDFLNKHGIKLMVAGELEKLNEAYPMIVKNVQNTIQETRTNSRLTLVIAFSYGGRAEIVDACNSAISEKMLQLQTENLSLATEPMSKLEKNLKITEDDFTRNLYVANMPDLDIVIRTSGVKRLSNFLLWQCSYAELFFLDKMWPDFGPDDLKKVVEEFRGVKRNFGAR